MFGLTTRRRCNVVAAALAVSGSGLGLAALVGVTGTAPTASADPSYAVGLDTVVGVGSDVSQDLFDALSGASPDPGLGDAEAPVHYYTPLQSSAATGDYTIESFDANEPNQPTTYANGIITTLGGPLFDRPNSSTQGITALDDEWNGVDWGPAGGYTTSPVDISNQIQFARSARSWNTDTSTELTWIPYARDGLGILYYEDGNDALTENPLTNTELQDIYSAGIGNGSYSINGVTTYGCLPFSGTTPRSNLEAVLSLPSSTTGWSGCNNLVQNSGNSFYSFANGLGTSYDAVIPISVGSWIGQANGLAVDRISEVLGNSDYGLASIEDGTTELGSPTTGTAPNLAPNTTYYQDQNGTYGGGKWGYDLYTVVWTEYVTAGGHYQNTVIESLFDGSSSALCSAYAQGLVNDFGFDSLQSDETGATSGDPTGGYTCGEVTAALEGNA